MTCSIIGTLQSGSTLPLPLFASRVQAGFPSPAADYVEQPLDLNELCIERPAATYYARVSGESMTGAGIFPGDLLVVDRGLEPGHGDIVVVAIDGEFTVKELQLNPPRLVAHNPAFAPILLTEDSQVETFGTVTWIFRRARARRGGG